ncbi:SLC13 family permease [Rhodococcus koreensis]
MPYNFRQKATLAAIVGLTGTMIVLSTDHDPDIGVLSFAFAAARVLKDPAAGTKALPRIDWSTVLLVGGIITFVGVLEELDAVDLVGECATGIGVPLLLALFLCVVAGLVSTFASTTWHARGPRAADRHRQHPRWALICAIGVRVHRRRLPVLDGRRDTGGHHHRRGRAAPHDPAADEVGRWSSSD